ncbi:MAG: MFS transporter [Methanomicrobiales archaeon]|nr:MFS transporter [Methanomicrobiales archaeon]
MNDTGMRGVALLVAVLAGFITPFDHSAVNIALPTIGTEFAMDAVALSWVSTAYLLASAIFLVPLGRYADIHGRKKVFVSGLSIFTAASLLLIFSPSSIVLIVLRVLQGMGAAMIFGTGVAILTSVFPPGERGRVLGLYTTAVYVGLSAGPFLGGLVTQYVGWRGIFLVNVPLGILTVALVHWRLAGEWAEARGEPFDLAGSVIYGLSLASLLSGFTLLPEIGGIALAAAGTAGLLLFFAVEARQKSPVLHVNLFLRNRVFAFSNLAALINYSATFAVTFFLSLYLQYIGGFTPQTAGLILVSQPLVMATLSPYAGRLSDRVEPRIISSAGMAVIAVGLFLLTFLNPDTPLPYLVGCLVLLGLGFAFFSSPNTNAIMSSVEKRFYSVASGTLGTMRLLGQMLSMAIAVLIFAVYLGRVQITPELSAQFLMVVHTAFAVFTVLCIFGVVFSSVRGAVR